MLLSNQGKSNTSGRIDEQGALRHRYPELCVIGALGFYLFSRFHILEKSPPDFKPVYKQNDPQDMGVRAWYGLHLFPGGDGETSEMSYESESLEYGSQLVIDRIQIIANELTS